MFYTNFSIKIKKRYFIKYKKHLNILNHSDI